MELVLHDMLDCLQPPIRILMFFYVTTWKTREQGKEKLHWIPAHHPSFLNLILNWFSMCKYLILQLFSARKQVESQNYILIFVSIELWFCFWPMGVGEDVLILFNSKCFFCKVNVSTERKRDISFVTALCIPGSDCILLHDGSYEIARSLQSTAWHSLTCLALYTSLTLTPSRIDSRVKYFYPPSHFSFLLLYHPFFCVMSVPCFLSVDHSAVFIHAIKWEV